MNFLPIISRLIKNPNNEWDNIAHNKIENKNILTQYLIPLVIIGCIIKILGRFISLGDYSILNSVIVCLSYILVNILNIYVSAWIISQTQPKFKQEKDFNRIFKLISLSSFPYIIASSIASTHPSLSFLHLVSVFSLVLFWTGSQKILSIQKELLTGFILIGLVIIASVSLISNFIITSLLLSVFLNF